MKRKYKVSLICISICIICLTFLEAGYIGYLKEEEQTMAMVKVKSGLSINYLSGNEIKTNDETYEIDFSITNAEENSLNYYIKLKDITSDDNVTYKIIFNEEEKENPISKTVLYDKVIIEPTVTDSYRLIINNPKKQLFKATLEIDTLNIDYNLKNTIIKNNPVTNVANMDFKNLDEGSTFIEEELENGNIYYFRGATLNNYVSFANKMWRIVRINEDGTVLLVLDELLEEEQAIFENNEEETTDFLKSQMYTFLTSWYDTNLKDYDEYIASAKYCTDDNAQVDDNGKIYYLPEQRLFTDYSPVFTCPGTTFTAKIALLTADDVMLAGSSSSENKNYYLKQDNINREWWTMTLNKKEDNKNHYITVLEDGSLAHDKNETQSYGVRPAITLIKKLNATGKGTIDDPYVLSTL